jgi:hypothetical protein
MSESVEPTLEIGPFSEQEGEELAADLRDAGVECELERSELGGFKAGDPMSIAAIVLLTSTAITAITAFLLKKRRRVGVRYTANVTLPDGTKFNETFEMNSSESEAPNADVVAVLERMRSKSLGQLGEASGE